MMTQASLSQINSRDLLTLTAEVHVADGRTPGAGLRWTNLGNLPSLEYAPNATNKTTMISVRGVRKPGKSHTTGIEPKYTATGNELTPNLMDMIWYTERDHDFGSDGADNAQTGLSADAGSAFDFDESDEGKGVQIGDRTDILDDEGNHIIGVTAVVLAGVLEAYGSGGDAVTLAEGIDYELDGDIGQIRWLRAINDDVITPTITSRTISADDTDYMTKSKPFFKGYVERLCRIYWFDQDEASNWVIWHKDFLGRFSVTRGFNADGQADVEPQLQIEILTEGVIYKRKA